MILTDALHEQTLFGKLLGKLGRPIARGLLCQQEVAHHGVVHQIPQARLGEFSPAPQMRSRYIVVRLPRDFD